MSTAAALHWLPHDEQWRSRFKQWRLGEDISTEGWQQAIALANHRLDFTLTNALDAAVQSRFAEGAPSPDGTPIRLAILSSSTTAHLHASIRVAALRRGLSLTIYETDFGQYLNELLDSTSRLHAFAPTAILFALDAHHLTQGASAGMDEKDAEATLSAVMGKIAHCWQLARDAFGAPILHQTMLDVFPGLLGNNEHRLPGSPSAIVAGINARLRDLADRDGVDLVAVDRRQAIDGRDAWYNPALWHRAKQEIAPAAAPFCGDLVVRLLAAQRGLSRKCLALDLDNTLWGGVIGDDGVDGIVLGQGSASGEAFVALQGYARQLARRGIILAVCSKNDEANAREAFDKHPDMLLRGDDIACFVANWDDKATNIRRIAQQLNIGLEAIVFLDDNPFERELVRKELPMVAVPEVSEDPAAMAQAIADAGYFEATALTDDDRRRAAQYRDNIDRQALLTSTTDLAAYLRDLDQSLIWNRFDHVGRQRIVQLINKTNQFNLTTRRYTDDEVRAIIDDDRMIGLQFRLRDRFGDNGVIAIVIGTMGDDGSLTIDNWLMSCRVLGRQVEAATLDVLVEAAREKGATRLIGRYLPTAKNAMVADLLPRLGFGACADAEGDERWVLALSDHQPSHGFIRIMGGSDD